MRQLKSFLRAIYGKIGIKSHDSLLQHDDFMPNTSFRHKGKNKKEFNQYGKDKSGKITYRYNRLGYRGEEFDLNAKFRIYLCGCSHTHGTGLNWEDTFGFIFKEYVAQFFNIEKNQVNLMNFSAGAASNSYMVRTLITQCNIVRPNIIICNFGHKSNLEFKSRNSNRPFCPSIKEHDLELLNHPMFNEFNLFIESAKNMLLLQYYCRLKQIPYLFAWVDMPTMERYLNRIQDTHRFISEELDLDYFVSKSIRDKEIRVDLAADADLHGQKAHGGVEANRIYGKLLFDKFVELYGGNASLASPPL